MQLGKDQAESGPSKGNPLRMKVQAIFLADRKPGRVFNG